MHGIKHCDSAAIVVRPVDRVQRQLKPARQRAGIEKMPCGISPRTTRIRDIRHLPEKTIVISIEEGAGLSQRVSAIEAGLMHGNRAHGSCSQRLEYRDLQTDDL